MSDIIRTEGIVKSYPPDVVANAGVSLSLHSGEIHAIVGQNGAGKSTLMKILHGEEQPDSGCIYVGGRLTPIASPLAARGLGIGMVHQEFKLFPSLSAAENVVLGGEPRWGGVAFHERAANERVAELSERYGLAVDPRVRVGRLSVGQKQRLEILKMLYQGARVLILDEPTAVLTRQEVEALFATLRRLSAEGHTIALITHKIPEVIEISQRVSVMSAGRIVCTRPTSDLSEGEICRLMISCDLEPERRRSPRKGASSPVLQVENLSIQERGSQVPILDGISFEVDAGEIFAIAGVAGNGQAELVEALFGLRAVSSGSIRLKGGSLRGLRPRQLRSRGVAYVPGERAVRGAALPGALWENLLADRLESWRGRVLLDRARIKAAANEGIREYGIKASSWTLPAGALSGGNLQKLVLCRELKAGTSLALIEEPARGLDILSAEFVYERILRIREEGCAVVLASSDLAELMMLADRIGVMYRGRLAAVFPNRANLSPYEIGEYMMGLKTEQTGGTR